MCLTAAEPEGLLSKSKSASQKRDQQSIGFDDGDGEGKEPASKRLKPMPRVSGSQVDTSSAKQAEHVTVSRSQSRTVLVEGTKGSSGG